MNPPEELGKRKTSDADAEEVNTEK